MSKRMQHQGGWAVTFIVVGAVLVLGLLGGVYYLKHRGEGAAETAKEPTVSAPGSSSTDKKNDASGNNTSGSNSSNPSGSNSSDTSKSDNTNSSSSNSSGSDQSATSGSTGSSADTSSSSSSDSSTSTSDTASDASSTAAELPQTGPADIIGKLVAVSLLSFAGVAYLRSRSSTSVSL